MAFSRINLDVNSPGAGEGLCWRIGRARAYDQPSTLADPRALGQRGNMHLASLKIENYRGFSKIEVDFDQTTVLIGENNSGKTSVLEAIRTCLSRSFVRKGNPFEDHDYHMPSNKSRPGEAGPLVITLDFAEEKTGEWPPEVIQDLAEVVVLHPGDIYHARLRVESKYEPSIADFAVSWEFLDPSGKPLPKAKKTQNLVAFQSLNPIFYLPAVRDAAKDFNSRSTFWAPFLRNPSIPQSVQAQLEKELAALNDKVIQSEQRLNSLSKNLSKAQKVVSLGGQDVVSIEAFPTKIWDMLSRAQVNVAGATGASLPLAQHGAGTQSLATIFLFEAFLGSGIVKPDPHAEPILEIEEPELHLHPSAVRALWSILGSVKGQKIIATHSGDLLSEIPLSAIRRFKRKGSAVEVLGLRPGTLTKDDERKIQFHVRRTRGELLFARCWLLHEGETEYWVLSESARALGLSLEERGVRLVEYASAGVESFIRLADDLGICWHCMCDGDSAGQANAKAASGHLNGRKQKDHVSVLPKDNIELILCDGAFGPIYEANILPAKASQVTVAKGHPDYWKQVLSSQRKRYKTQCAARVAEQIQQSGATVVPKSAVEILNSAMVLAN